MEQIRRQCLDLLRELNAPFEEKILGRKLLFKFTQALTNGPTVLSILELDTEISLGRIMVMNYVEITNPSTFYDVFRLINELNIEYTFAKFILYESKEIHIVSYFSFIHHFEAREALKYVYDATTIAQDELSRFMKVL